MSKRRKIFICLAVVLFVGLAWLYLTDDKLGDHSDLLPTVTEDPAGLAAYEKWLAFATKVEDPAVATALSNLRGLSAGQWQSGDHEKHFALVRPLLAELMALSELPALSFPDITKDTFLTANVPANTFQSVFELFPLATTERLWAEDFAGAARVALGYLRATDRFATADGTLITFLIAVSRSALAIDNIQQVLDYPLAEAELRMLLSQLEQEVDWGAQYVVTHQYEFQLLLNSKGQLGDKAFVGLSEGAPPRFLLKPNRTVNTKADRVRALIAEIPKTAIDRQLESRPPWRGSVMDWISSNAYGDYLLDLTGSEMEERILNNGDKAIATRCLTLARVALLLHHAKHGELPADLSALTPGLLPAVPLDPYDGKALRYDPAAEIVWSVGVNHTDEGGNRYPIFAEIHSGKDLTSRILVVDKEKERPVEAGGAE